MHGRKRGRSFTKVYECQCASEDEAHAGDGGKRPQQATRCRRRCLYARVEQTHRIADIAQATSGIFLETALKQRTRTRGYPRPIGFVLEDRRERVGHLVAATE